MRRNLILIPMTYNRLNNAIGWAMFGIALLVYLLTVAPTASFWDCGEFIACANELEVTHPPGAPLFLLLGRLMAMLAFEPGQVAFMVNLLSVFSSAFTVLFTFWITTILARKGVVRMNWSESTMIIATMGAGVIAALTCTFADSIWFNAVEAEVYAMSSFFTAIVFWLMLKWEARADEPDHLRWIVLIAFVMGLSTGVHLLNLLTIPALAMIYYFRKFEFRWLGVMATLGISVLTLAAIQYGVLQMSISLARDAELLFTGTETRAGAITGGWGLPPGTGAVTLLGLTVLLLAGLIWWSQRRGKVVLNTALLALTVILLGASSYTTIYLRSNADPAIDMNNPENVLTFLSYMRREQYGDRPLLYGPLYSAEVQRNAQGEPVKDITGMRHMVLADRERYVEDVEEFDYVHEDNVLFPRMYETSRYRSGPFGYERYVSDKGADPNDPRDDNPTRGEDLTFFFDYQVAHMYLRYFLWNFVGRESDIQDDRWESGFETFSDTRYTSDRRENKGKNHYYFLPLFLGLLGIVWQSLSRKHDAAILGLLFFFTGIAIIIYLNQYPGQPRERDYSYAGSFQAFSIWVGLGVLFLTDILKTYLRQASAIVATALALIAPVLMAAQNWDDHTRKGRWIDVEFAKNMLSTCEENAILFTGGDNDTFPLWYAQEVEGFRTDVRVVNLELLISDWYIDQMRERRNDSPPLPITMEPEEYQGERDLVYYNYQPKLIRLPVDKPAAVASGLLNEAEAALTGDEMLWPFRPRAGGYILRKDSVMINLISNVARAGWKRPIYFGNTMPSDNYLGLDDYLRNEGLAYRLTPLRKSRRTTNDLFTGTVRTDILKSNLVDAYQYTGLDDPSVYFDEHIRNVIISNYRNLFFRLGNAYANEYTRRDTLMQQLQNRLGDLADDNLAQAESQIAGWEQEKQQLRQAAQDILALGQRRIPDAVIRQENLYLILRQAAVLEQVEDPAGAAEYYALAGQRGIEQLQDEQAMGQEITQQSLPLQACFFTMQFYQAQGQMDKLRALGAQLDKVLGMPITEQFLQQPAP